MMSWSNRLNEQKWIGDESVKCEYRDNPGPNGSVRCPSCGATIQLESVRDCESIKMPEQERSAQSCIDPFLYVEKKSRVVYIILGIFFGPMGVHNFYAGYMGRGIAQLLITLLSCGLLCWVSWIWAFIEICVLEHDGRLIPFD